MEENKALRFLDFFSIITIGENKIPNTTWKEQQSVKLSYDSFVKNYRQPSTTGIGIVTGFESLEVIDVDTKVFSTQQEKDDFWNEYYQSLKDNNILRTRKVWNVSKILLKSTFAFWFFETLFFIIKDGFHLRAETKSEMICDNIIFIGFWLFSILFTYVIANTIDYLLSYDKE